MEGDSIIFKGIPCAAPPVGQRRFSAPQEHDDWEGELLCDKWPSDAYRIPLNIKLRSMVTYPVEHVYDEDCLYMNIWKPAGYTGEKLLVMFWIYRAGGGSHDACIDGRACNQKGCILVSFNYRMGIFGYF